MKTYIVDGQKEFTSMKEAVKYAKKTCPVFARIRVYIDGVINKSESVTVWFYWSRLSSEMSKAIEHAKAGGKVVIE